MTAYRKPNNNVIFGSPKSLSIGWQATILAVGWSLLTLFTMGLDMWHTRQKSIEAGRLQARVAIEKDKIYRFWITRIGRVYGEIGENLRPNPHLSVPDRDIETTTGIKLTRITQDSMTRQVHDLVWSHSVLSGHITSLRPLRPMNTPDLWETNALRRFEQGEEEVSSLETDGDQEFMRLMRPLKMEASCMPCHGDQGYTVGDNRGGISVRVSMQEMWSLYNKQLLTIYFLYSGVWLVGLIGLGFGSRRLQRQMNQRFLVERNLQDFKLSLDNIHDSVLMFDADTHSVFYSNQGTVILTGFSESDLLQKSISDLLAPESSAPFTQILGPLYRREIESQTFECNFVHREGYPIPVEVHISYVVPRREAERFLIVARDIRERKTAEKEKEMMQTRLLQAQKLESIGQLAAGIAHEINTPLQFITSNMSFLKESFEDIIPIIDAYSQRASERGAGEVQQNEAMEELSTWRQEVDWEYLRREMPSAIMQSLDGLHRVGNLVLAMKSFSHPGSVEPVPENINSIIETTILISKNEWKYVADLQTDLAANLPPVPCLRNEIGQVLLNLIINAAQAIKGMKQSGQVERKGVIAIRSSQVGDSIEIAVQDNGGGIPPAIYDRIFEPFFTTKEVGQGSGQGLAICRDTIENKHLGQLTFSSEEGVGTIFYIRLPLQPVRT